LDDGDNLGEETSSCFICIGTLR